ncbi:hypothetical protein ACFCP7_10465 [Paenibacillus elgii]
MIQKILTSIRDTMQNDKRLSSIQKYHLVDGMLPGGIHPSVCIGCNRLRYSDYDRDQDEVIAPVRIYLYMHDAIAERGEEKIRGLTNDIRYAILANQYLDGLVDAMTIVEISFDSTDVSTGQFIHFAAIDVEAKYYEPRRRAQEDLPTVREIENEISQEGGQ